MKKILFYLLCFLILVGCKQNSKDNREEKSLIIKEDKEQNELKDSISTETYEEMSKFVYSFYDSYIKEVDNFPINFKKIDSLKFKFCSKELLTKLDSLDLSYDPFLNAQDVTANLMNSLVINKEKNDLCIVTYIDDYTKKRILMKLKVNKLEEGFEISDIIN